MLAGAAAMLVHSSAYGMARDKEGLATKQMMRWQMGLVLFGARAGSAAGVVGRYFSTR